MRGCPCSGHRPANLAALAAHSPKVAEMLRSVIPRNDLRVWSARSGALTARVADTTLHSTYDPVAEARRLVAAKVSERTSACAVLGLGLGYHVEELVRIHPDLPIAVIEPDVSLFAALLDARDFTRILEAANVRMLLASAPEEVASALEDLPLGELALIAPPPFRALNASYCERVEAAIHAAKDRKQINVNTLARFGALWVRNLLSNVGALVARPGVSELAGRFRGLPALVVAAGPTLDEVEPLLPELARRMLVVAVDSSVGACMRQDLEPDLIVTVDPQYWNTRYFDRLDPRSSILVCEPSTNPVALRRLGIPTFFTSSLFALGRLLEATTGEKGRIGAGGSVATSAWDVARLLGCSPIVFAGLDLGFPGGRTHARGLYFEELMVMTATRLVPAEQQGYRFLGEAGSLRLPSTGGGQTLTDRRMLVYKWWFERQLALPSAPRTMTLSSGGVRIDAIELVSAETLARLPGSRGDIAGRVGALRALRADPQTVRSSREGVRAALRRLLEDLADIERSAEHGLGETAELERALALRDEKGTRRGAGAEVAGRLASLEAIDRRILSSASREVVGFLMQRLINEVTGTRGSAHALESSRSLYRELAESARLHVALVSEALRCLEGPAEQAPPEGDPSRGPAQV